MVVFLKRKVNIFFSHTQHPTISFTTTYHKYKIKYYKANYKVRIQRTISYQSPNQPDLDSKASRTSSSNKKIGTGIKPIPI